MIRYLLLGGTMLLTNALTHFSEAHARTDIVIPNPKILGTKLGTESPLQTSNVGENAIYPKNIHLDLDGPRIYGIMATYPDSVTFESIVECVNLTHKKWSRDPDGEMAKWGVTVWRNEEDRYAVQASDSRLIFIWLDRKITQEEVNATTKLLFEDAVQSVFEPKEVPAADGEKDTAKKAQRHAEK